MTVTAAGDDEKQPGNSDGNNDSTRIYVYNLDDKQTPGGLKVRIKIRVVTGDEARRLDARQNAALMELIRCKQQRSRPGRQPSA